MDFAGFPESLLKIVFSNHYTYRPPPIRVGTWRLKQGYSLAQHEKVSLSAILDRLRINFGLDSDIISVGADYLVSSCLSSYMRAFPSRRTVGIRVCQGYSNSKIVESIDEFLHFEGSPTVYGRQLPGGIRLYIQAPLGDTEDVEWFNPPISVYQYQGDDSCFTEESPDIYLHRQNSRCHFIHMTGKENIACQEVIAGRQFFSNR